MTRIILLLAVILALAAELYPLPSYTNYGGSGDRTATVSTFSTPTLAIGSTQCLLNGIHTGPGLYFDVKPITGWEIGFNFHKRINISQLLWYQDAGNNPQGTWSFQGTNDTTSGWTTISSSNFIINCNPTKPDTITLSSNSVYDSIFRFYGISGASTNNPYVQQVEFKTDTIPPLNSDTVFFKSPYYTSIDTTGITDASIPWMSALTDMNATGKVLYIPKGYYLLDSTGPFVPFIKVNTTICGDGKDLVTLKIRTWGGTIQVEDPTVKIHDIGFRGVGVIPPGPSLDVGIQLGVGGQVGEGDTIAADTGISTDHAEVWNCKFVNFFKGIVIYDRDTAHPIGQLIHNCEFDSNSYGVKFNAWASNDTLKNSTTYHNNVGVQVMSWNYAILGNSFSDLTCIDIEKSQHHQDGNGLIKGNNFNYSSIGTQDFIYVDSLSHGNISIDSNTFTFPGDSILIHVKNPSQVTFTRNYYNGTLLSSTGMAYNGPAFTNYGGKGDRSATVTVSATPSLYGGTVNLLIDGERTGTGFYFQGSSAAGKSILFNFHKCVNIIKVLWYQQAGNYPQGTWSFQGTNDSVKIGWTTFGSTFIPNCISAYYDTIAVMSGNTQYDSLYRFHGESGTTSITPYVTEMEFKIDTMRTNGSGGNGGLVGTMIGIAIAIGAWGAFGRRKR